MFISVEQIKSETVFLQNESDIAEYISNKARKAQSGMELSLVESLKKEITGINTSANELKEIKGYISYFSDKNIDTGKIKDTYEEAIYYLNKRRYEKIYPLYDGARNLFLQAKSYEDNEAEIKNEIQAIQSGDFIESTTGLAYSNGLTNMDYEAFVAFNEKLNESNRLYKESDFFNAEKILEELRHELYDYKSKQIESQGFYKNQMSIIGFIKTNLKVILIIAFSLVFLVIILSRPIAAYLRSRKVIRLEHGKKTLTDLMKQLQEQYYVQKSISKKVYTIKLRHCQQKFIKITDELALMKEKIK
jgi:hypothetical protein